MVRLHAEVHQAEVAALAARCDRSAKRCVLPCTAQRRQSGPNAHRHLHREPSGQGRARAVRDSGSFPARLGPSPLAPSTPAIGKSELRLSRLALLIPSPTQPLLVLCHRAPPARRRSRSCAVALDRAGILENSWARAAIPANPFL